METPHSILTQDEVRRLFTYNPETGDVVRRVSAGRRFAVGTVLKSMNDEGYIRTRINLREYKIHRLIWLYVHGVWPSGDIDHINGIKSDNRLANLRDVPRSLNQLNRHSPSRRSTSGFLGVSLDRQTGRWMAQVGFQGKMRRIGSFETPEEASDAYRSAKRELRPEAFAYEGDFAECGKEAKDGKASPG